MAEKEEMILEKKRKHTKFPKIKFEKCGEKVKIVDPLYPQSYTYGNCGHVFTWVEGKEN